MHRLGTMHVRDQPTNQPTNKQRLPFPCHNMQDRKIFLTVFCFMGS